MLSLGAMAVHVMETIETFPTLSPPSFWVDEKVLRNFVLVYCVGGRIQICPGVDRKPRKLNPWMDL